MKVIQALSLIGLLILLVNTVLYFVGYSKKGVAYKIYVLYLFAILIIQSIVEFYAFRGLNNHFISTFYLFLQFILLSLFFYFIFKGVNKLAARIIKYITIAGVAGLGVQYAVKTELYFHFNSFGFLFTSLAIITYAVLYLYEHISAKLPYIYITIGIIMYYISSSLIFATATSIVSFGDEVNLMIWKINAILFILYQLLILWEWKQMFYSKEPVQAP